MGGPITIDRPLHCDPADPHTRGLWLCLERRILVQSTLRRDIAWRIFFHEYFHACIDDAGVRLTEDQEEAVCDALSSGCLRLLRHTLKAGA